MAPLLVTLIIWAGSFGFSCTVLAADPASACPPGSPPNQTCLENPLVKTVAGKQTVVNDFPTVLGTIIKAALGIVGSLTLLMLVWGGFQWLTSAGNPEKVKKGSQTMIWAAIGAFLVLTSYLIMSTFTDYLVSGGGQAPPSGQGQTTQ